jgi:hypothetical protein
MKGTVGYRGNEERMQKFYKFGGKTSLKGTIWSAENKIRASM